MNLDLDFHAEVEADIFKIHEYLGVSKDFDIETGTPTAYVTYELQPEAREWGLKYISVVVRKVICSIEWEVNSLDLTDEEKQLLIKAGGTEFRNETIGGVIEIDSTVSLPFNFWVVNCDAKFKDDGGFQIDDASIDFGIMTISLS